VIARLDRGRSSKHRLGVLDYAVKPGNDIDGVGAIGLATGRKNI
jgi:hypothetical protein